MKKGFWKQNVRQALLLGLLLVGSLWLVSCEDDYIYNDEEPTWLGSSIYDYLVEQDRFSIYLQLIDDVGYGEVLKHTGSKTLFVADDDAFSRFFADNQWGVSGYDDLSLTQKKLILNYGMVDNAYLMQTFANYNDGELVEGRAFRRATALSPFDSVAFENGSRFPDTRWWASLKDKGAYLLKDYTSKPMVYFLDRPMRNAGVSNEDFKLFTSSERQDGDAHIFGNRILERDVVCKNGYVNVLAEVMLPPHNMAEYLRENPTTTVFSSLLERFSVPLYSSDIQEEYRQINPVFSDSLFVKEYFASLGGITQFPDNGNSVPENLLLPFNPGWNAYRSEFTAMQGDMAAMLVPNDAAMESFLNDTEEGRVLRDYFGDWSGVPDHIVMKFLQRHMRTSFINSVPSRFDRMTDSNNDDLPIELGHIDNSYMAVNGLVYETNTVYPPSDYISVYAPVLFGGNSTTRIFDWIVSKLDYTFYLNSLQSNYSFFVPTDAFFEGYIDPVMADRNEKGVIKYRYNETFANVEAVVYEWDRETNTVGDSLRTITYSSPSEVNEQNDFILNRLWDLLENHIVVGALPTDSEYVLTKGGTLLRVRNPDSPNMTVQGIGNVERGEEVGVSHIFEQANGKTYLIDRPLQSPLNSAYSVLSTRPEFSVFFDLMSGFTDDLQMFVRKVNNIGIDQNLRFVNSFHYSLYVPTNAALNQAIMNGVVQPWESGMDYPGIVGINDMPEETAEDIEKKEAAIAHLERFLRYHFQDYALTVGGTKAPALYQTSTIKTDDAVSLFGTRKNKYYKLRVSGTGNDLTIETENGDTARVLTEGEAYNMITRDYIFNVGFSGANPNLFQSISGVGNGPNYNTSRIVTSSTLVIHQIDKVLTFGGVDGE